MNQSLYKLNKINCMYEICKRNDMLNVSELFNFYCAIVLNKKNKNSFIDDIEYFQKCFKIYVVICNGYINRNDTNFSVLFDRRYLNNYIISPLEIAIAHNKITIEQAFYSFNKYRFNYEYFLNDRNINFDHIIYTQFSDLLKINNQHYSTYNIDVIISMYEIIFNFVIETKHKNLMYTLNKYVNNIDMEHLIMSYGKENYDDMYIDNIIIDEKIEEKVIYKIEDDEYDLFAKKNKKNKKKNIDDKIDMNEQEINKLENRVSKMKIMKNNINKNNCIEDFPEFEKIIPTKQPKIKQPKINQIQIKQKHIDKISKDQLEINKMNKIKQDERYCDDDEFSKFALSKKKK